MKKRVRKKQMPHEVIELGIRIQHIIIQKNLKIRNVAHDANLDVENLRKYIKGKQEMKITTMLKIVNALNIEVNDLFKKDS